MRGMASAKEYFTAPPPGRYLCKIVACTDGVSKAGNTMLTLELEVREPKEHAGATARDYIITDGGSKGGGMGKTKLRGLGVPVDSDNDVPDSVIANNLLGLELFVELGNEQQMGKDANGDYTVPQTAFDDQLQKLVPINKSIVKGYFRHGVGAAPSVNTQIQSAPQGYAPQQIAPGFQQVQLQPQYAQQPQQMVQPQVLQAAPQQFAPQGQPQFVGAPQLVQNPQYVQQAPQQFAGAQPQYTQQAPVQQQFAPQGQPNGQGGVPPWAANTAVAEEGGEAKKTRKPRAQ